MAYQVSGSEKIKDDNTVTFKNVTVKNYYTVMPAPAASYVFQGSTSGYTSGGQNPPVAPAAGFNTIDKFPFSSDANATDVGDLTLVRTQLAGQSSAENGYSTGGYTGSTSNVIDKFPFSSNANASDVGDLSVVRFGVAGQSSNLNGYTSGGRTTADDNIIDKFPFTADANATDVGDLSYGRAYSHGQSSSSDGYTSGGNPNGTPYTYLTTIDKFPFSSDANAVANADLSFARTQVSGQSSTTHGYTAGGFIPPYTNIIDKFPFASGGTSSDVGDLSQTRVVETGQSSTASGYASGGSAPGPYFSSVTVTTIDKFPFSSDANATDVGDLTQARSIGAGQQV